ncbi:MAG: BrnT family toxin [Thermomicrobiales bacterium]
MNFEWDEAKRLSTLAKHRIDFVDVRAIFDGRPTVTTVSADIQERRFLTTGVLAGVFQTVVWTWRTDDIRLISARRSRDGEERAYRALHG